jgi:mitochondrial fission protein ELM1
VNLCWVFSDGRKGHEIQSMTVANALTTDVELYTFTLRQPWLTFAPRRLPQFDKAIKWSSTPPIEQPPELIITTGRKAAAVGKHYKSFFRSKGLDCKHIQILNPKDNLKKYDWVLIPEHDNVKGANVINFQGSIHPYDEQWFTQNKDSSYSHYLAVFLGNPPKKYFNKQFKEEILTIRSCFKNSPLYFCGSPRLDKNIRTKIRQTAIPSDKVWLSYDDGANPYQTLLKNAKKIFVTSDSINMINEACASHVSVSILANNLLPSPKHQRFINTMSDRICDLSDNRTHSLKKPYRHSITNLLARIYPDDDI